MASPGAVQPAPAKRRSHLVHALRLLLFLAVPCLLLWLFRTPLLRGLGNYLITEDAPARVDAVFVLGGSVRDRGLEAARIHQHGLSQRFVFTGAPVPSALEALGLDSTEAECTRNTAVVAGIPLAQTTALNVGTSTFEEAEALLQYARQHGLDTVMVISNRFHLRRIAQVFRPRFGPARITVLLHGAPSADFDEAFWWRSEDGLVMLNNEYLKLVYYRLKY